MKIPLVAAACAVVLGCGGGVREAAHYSGDQAPPLVAAWQVRDEPDMPLGYQDLGEVSAGCTFSEGRRSIEHEWLSDVDCSEARVVRALREAASAKGGELLVARSCNSRRDKQRAGVRDWAVRCRATVARPETALAQQRSRASQPGISPEQAETVDEPSASEAWRIRVDFTPARESTGPRAPRRADLVRELAVLPPSHLLLGDVVTRCRTGCALENVRAGVRIAAGRMGATDVVDVRCIAKGAGYLCSGSAAAYEVDPERDPRAR
jgi:hypothetical protein